MVVHVCSLKYDSAVDGTQTIPVSSGYTLLKFPYIGESYDPDDMHTLTYGGVDHPYPSDPASGLIHPAHDAWGRLYAMVQWETLSGSKATECRDQFVRDPLGVADTTCTEHRCVTVGMQCYAKSWGIFVHPDVPLGLRVSHNASVPLKLVLAEFKLEYSLDPGP